MTNSDLNTKLDDYVTDTALGQKGFLTDIVGHEHVNDLKVTEVQSGVGNGIASISKNGKTLYVTKGKFLTAHQSLADYATKTWVGDQGFAKGTIPTKVSDLQNDSGFLTETALAPYVNDVDKATSDLPYYNGFAVSYMQKKGNKLEFELKPFFNTLDIEDTAKKDGNGIAEISIGKTKNLLHVKKGKFITETTLGTAIDDYASKKGYLTKEDMKETVRIRVVGNKIVNDENLIGVTVTVKSGNETIGTYTWQGNSIITVKIPAFQDITIEASKKNMYMTPKALKFTTISLNERSVVLEYKALETGVFVIDKNDKFYKTADEFKNAGTSTNDVIGALIVTDKVAIIVANYVSNTVEWGPAVGVLVNGCTISPDSSSALKDFSGAANTAAIIKAGCPSNTAASICYNYTFKNGRRGYLMSAGEASAIQTVSRDIWFLFKKIGLDYSFIANGNERWTSTQTSERQAWSLDIGSSYSSLSIKTKDNMLSAIPICSLYD